MSETKYFAASQSQASAVRKLQQDFNASPPNDERKASTGRRPRLFKPAIACIAAMPLAAFVSFPGVLTFPPAVGGSLLGPPSEAMFSFEVCNRTSMDVLVSVAGRLDPDSSDWTVAGWWTVQPSSCQVVGRFSKGHIYYMAKAAGRGVAWNGKDKQLCVSNETFSRVNNGGPCGPGQPREGFYDHIVNDSKLTWTLNP